MAIKTDFSYVIQNAWSSLKQLVASDVQHNRCVWWLIDLLALVYSLEYRSLRPILYALNRQFIRPGYQNVYPGIER